MHTHACMHSWSWACTPVAIGPCIGNWILVNCLPQSFLVPLKSSAMLSRQTLPVAVADDDPARSWELKTEFFFHHTYIFTYYGRFVKFIRGYPRFFNFCWSASVKLAGLLNSTSGMESGKSDSMISTSLPPCAEYSSDPVPYHFSLPATSVLSVVEVPVAPCKISIRIVSCRCV